MYIFGRIAAGISQWRVIGVPPTAGNFVAEALLPLLEIERAGERRQHDELREGDIRALGERRRGVERRRRIGRQPEDERAEHVNAVVAERLQTAPPARRRRD